MLLRAYRSSDAEGLAQVYRDAVIGTGSDAYAPRQVEVWSSYPDDMEEFRARLGRGLTLVAEEGSHPVAFGQLHPADHIALLYTASDHARRGYASRIYEGLEAHAMGQGARRLHTEASRVAKHFFLKMGFRLIDTEIAERNGVGFERFKMEKLIG